MALDFTTGVLDSRVTITRALNTATCVNSSGLIEIVNANLPRFDYDPVTLAPKGLLIEEQRANLVLYSQDFANASWAKSSTAVTSDTTTAPDGTTTADTLTSSSSTSGVVERNVTFTGDGDKAVSIFLKAGTSTLTYFFIRDTTASVTRGRARVTWAGGIPSATADLGGTIQGVDSFGNGWYRVRLLVPSVVAANTNAFRIQPDPTAGTNSVITWGAQAENGAFATSYIPTTTTSLTRNADAVSMTGTNFSDWYNASEGTFAVWYSSFAAVSVAAKAIVATNDGTTSNRIYAFVSTSGRPTMLVSTLGSAQVNMTNDIISAGASTKTSMAYKVDSFAVASNGGAVTTDAAGTIPTVTKLDIGCFASATNLNGHMQRLFYYPQRLLNAEAQAFSK
jgi:hypothetical protein